MHKIERIVRSIIGLGVASLAFWGPSNLWFLVALILPLTAGISWCPIYAALGINTAKNDKVDKA